MSLENSKRNIAILGSTGSIGTQALEVIELFPELLQVSVLTANNRADLLIEQARKFQPNAVVIANEGHYTKVRDALEDLPIKVWAGTSALEDCVTIEEIDVVLTALVGFSGLRPTIKAIEAGNVVASANRHRVGPGKRRSHPAGRQRALSFVSMSGRGTHEPH